VYYSSKIAFFPLQRRALSLKTKVCEKEKGFFEELDAILLADGRSGLSA
jgi:hypothetical protein